MTHRQLARLLPYADLPRPLCGGRTPTPLEARPDLSARLGPEVFLKREDLLDDLGGGHKVRKLDYVVADALRQGATALVTGGSLPSGQCVAVAAAARRHGLQSVLVYSGDEQRRPSHPQGSYLLALMLATEVVWHERTPWSRNAELLADACRRAAARGLVPYPIPPGITTWPGLLGSVGLGLELADQLGAGSAGALGVRPGPAHGQREVHVVVPAGSGATCLGLALAARLLGLRWKVHGVCIGGGRAAVEAEIEDLRREAARRLDRPDLADPAVAPVHVHDQWLAAGYDRPSEAELSAMAEAVGDHGLLLDPTYMLKAFLGLRGLAASGEIPPAARAVLVHTGGSLGLFGSSSALRSWSRERFAPFLAPATPDGVPAGDPTSPTATVRSGGTRQAGA
ncbi:1-aminocyclopropane-1-carboxylate deaminase/D-cysteine desulfhydrase [Streptomyces sp. NPDC127112]|uniref:1-aminocyclopropane-1-carboxylate deaminase/D-cysteine desulfhydrase n=1 Tax=Streptomyces sp. NPDC127112 TaxID=3345364 RepID=UPI0036321542